MVNTTPQHSVWFIPEETEAVPFVELVNKWAMEFHGPVFPPHVTLAADLTDSLPAVLHQTERIAEQLSAFEIVFDRTEVGESYFQCVYLKAVLNEQLWQARKLAAKEFQQPQLAENFMPHLSLLYGRFDATVKAAAQSRVVMPTDGYSFRAKSLVVYTAEPDPHQWQLVSRFLLK